MVEMVEFFIFLISVLQVSKGVEVSKSLLQPTLIATAKFTDGFGRSFRITHDADYWFDISKIKAEKKLDGIDKLCIQGVWLIYENADFQASSRNEVGVISGEHTCVSLKSYGKVTSMQPITLLSTRKSDTLAFFPDLDFSGTVWPVDKELENSQSPASSSLITLGKQEWTIIPSDNSDPICISPQGKNIEFPICFVSKLVDGEKIKSGTFTRIQKGCSPNRKAKRVEIHFCVDYDVAKIQRIEAIGTKMKGRSLGKSVVPGNKINTASGSGNECPDPDDEKLDKDGKYIINIRLTKDLQSNENYLWPKDPKNIWKLEMIDRVFNVVFATCSDDMVPVHYLQLIREIFVYLWDRSLLSSKNNSPVAVDENEWQLLLRQIHECNKRLRVSNFNIPQEAMIEYSSIASPSELNNSVDPMLAFRENLDPVIDAVYLVANHVAATCHIALTFESNFWANFIQVFQEMYLNQLESQWSTPGKLINAYKFVLGGYGIRNKHDKLGICATTALNKIPNLNPFDRSIDIKLK